VRLVYLDKAGVSNPKEERFLIVAGVEVNADKQFKLIEAHIGRLAKKYMREENRDDAAFHAMELFHGTKHFHRDRWPLELRLEILDELAIIPKKFDLPIIFGTTDRKSLPESLPADAPPKLIEAIAHAHAFFKCVTQVEIIMLANEKKEVAMVIVEDRERVRTMLKMSDEIFRARASRRFQVLANAEPWFNRLFPLERIVETLHFAQKGESSLLQVADICAFAIKRHLTKCNHAERLYGALEDQIVFNDKVMKALSSPVQSL